MDQFKIYLSLSETMKTSFQHTGNIWPSLEKHKDKE